MVANLANLACETTTAPGTSATVNLAGAVSGRTAIGLDIATGQSGYWVLEDGTQQEISYGAYTAGSPNTIARTTVIWNSSVGHATPSRLNFTGLTYVYPWLPAERALYVDTSGYADLKGYPLGVYGMQVQRGYLQGLELTRTGNTTLTIAAGIAADDVNRNGYIVATGSKTLNFGTTGAGGLDTGSFTSGNTYHVFIIGQADGTSAAFASLSLTPTLPASYVFRRRVGSVLSLTGPALWSWFQHGDEFWMDAPSYVELNTTPSDTTAHTLTLARCPSGIAVQMLLWIFTRYALNVSALEITDYAAGEYPTVECAATGNIGVNINRIWTNTSRQIRWRIATSGESIEIDSKGWIDQRGRNS